MGRLLPASGGRWAAPSGPLEEAPEAAEVEPGRAGASASPRCPVGTRFPQDGAWGRVWLAAAAQSPRSFTSPHRPLSPGCFAAACPRGPEQPPRGWGRLLPVSRGRDRGAGEGFLARSPGLGSCWRGREPCGLPRWEESSNAVGPAGVFRKAAREPHGRLPCYRLALGNRQRVGSVGQGGAAQGFALEREPPGSAGCSAVLAGVGRFCCRCSRLGRQRLGLPLVAVSQQLPAARPRGGQAPPSRALRCHPLRRLWASLCTGSRAGKRPWLLL